MTAEFVQDPRDNYLVSKLRFAFAVHPRESVISLVALEIGSISAIYVFLDAIDVQFSPEVQNYL